MRAARHALGRAAFSLALLAVPLVSACSLNPECRLTGVYGLQVAVEDTFTLEAIADSVTGLITGSSGYVDTLDLIQVDIAGRPWWLGGAVDRPGTYDVFLERPSYRFWEARGVVVRSNACGVEPTQIRARMCPESGACSG